jgi:hypothetical protein
MKKQHLFIVSIIIFMGLVFGIYQYFQVFETENVSAVNIGTPIAGHPWSQMECSSDTLCIDTVNKRLGIGTNNPTKALDVRGDGVFTGDVCNGTGNCLSALATLTNACGAAATNYIYSASAFSGSYCSIGTSTPTTPSFPAAGASTTWTCPVANDPTHPISCTATHAAAPVNGVCGAAATNYVYSATAYSGLLCSTGTANTNPAFPTVGSSSSWSCLGTNGGSSPSCTASRANPLPLVNSMHTELSCTDAGGTVVASDVSYSQCRFNAAACPTGWTRYKSFGANGACGFSCSITPAASWGNPPSAITCYNYPSCPYLGCGDLGCYGNCDWLVSCSGALAQVGCY